MRPDIYDKTQPHHVVERSDEIGHLGYHCKCGYMPPNNWRTGNYGANGKNVLHEHIKNSFDGRCHHKQYGMECVRYYGHRGIHRSPKNPRPPIRESVMLQRLRLG